MPKTKIPPVTNSALKKAMSTASRDAAISYHQRGEKMPILVNGQIKNVDPQAVLGSPPAIAAE